MKRLNRQARAYLLAVVTDSVCERCRSAPSLWRRGVAHHECGPCCIKRVDREEMIGEAPAWL